MDLIHKFAHVFAVDSADDFKLIKPVYGVESKNTAIILRRISTSNALVFTVLERIFQKQLELEKKIAKHFLNIPVAKIQT